MQEIEIKFVLNDQEFKQKLNIDDAKLAELISGAKNIQLGYDTSLAKMKLSEVRAEQARLKAELAEKIKLDVDMASIGETKSKLQQVEEALEGIVKKEKEAGSASGGWSLNIMGINQGLELVRKAWEALSVPIQKAGQFEQYLTSMKVMLGTTQAAKDRLAELVDFAKSTPFELPQVVEAANQLQAIGKYSEETLRDLGDLASASGKPMEQALSAFAKMATGQKGVAVDMFRDLLISVDDWVAATGKGVKATGELEASAEEMLTALPQIIKEKNFAGMMQAQSETFNGAVSNMKDGFDQLLTSMGEKLLPSAKKIVGSINGVLSAITSTSNFEQASKTSSELSSRFETLSFRVETLGKKTKLTESETKIYKESLDALQKEYPNYFKNINLNAEKYDSVMVAIKGAREELDKYIDSLIKAAILQDKYDQIKQIGLEINTATEKKLDVQEKIKKSKEDGSYNKTTYVDSGTGKTVAQVKKSTVYSEDLKRFENEITDLEKEKDKLQKRIEQILKDGTTETPAPTDDKKDDKTGDKKPPTGGTTTKKDYYKESLQDIKQANQEEILQEKAKNQTLTQLYQQKKESEQALLQASINLNKDANSEKLKTEFETAKENYNISVKLYDDKINEEQKFQDKKTQLLLKIEQENMRETFSHQLKNSTITELDEQLLQAKIEKSMIEDAMKLTSDAQRLDTLEKERTATSEKIQLIQAEINSKKEQLNTIDEFIVKEQEKEFIDRARKQSMLELERGILDEEINIQNLKAKLQQAKDSQEITALKAEIDRSNTRKKTMLDEVNVRQQLVAKTMLQYSEQYNAQESFGRQSNRILNDTIKNAIKAKIAEATATQIAWVIEILPWPLNAAVAPLAGLAIGALFDTLVPKFEYGGYPEGKNAIVQVNEKGQEFIVNAKATAKYSDILERMNAGVYQPSRPEYVSGDVYYPPQDNSGFAMLAEAIQEQTNRLESVERYVKVTELAEGLNNYQTQQSRLGY